MFDNLNYIFVPSIQRKILCNIFMPTPTLPSLWITVAIECAFIQKRPEAPEAPLLSLFANCPLRIALLSVLCPLWLDWFVDFLCFGVSLYVCLSPTRKYT